jgi:hypothetical protein
MLFAGLFAGLYGVLAISVIWSVFLFRKKVFGSNYMYPLYPLSLSGLLDYIVVIPKKVLGRKEGN